MQRVSQHNLREETVDARQFGSEPDETIQGHIFHYKSRRSTKKSVFFHQDVPVNCSKDVTDVKKKSIIEKKIFL